jgi:hypothetical protein
MEAKMTSETLSVENTKEKHNVHQVHDISNLDHVPASVEELRAVRWKVDKCLMPIMIGTYAIQFYGE